MSDRTVSAPPRWLAVVAVLLLAANLRAAVNVIGPLLPAVRGSLNLTGLQVGIVTALPTFCFAVVGLIAARLAARVGPTRTVVLSIACMAAGQILRALVPTTAALFAGTALALAAVAVANVLMPALISAFFPGRIPSMTAAYTVVLSGTGAVASGATLPLQEALGGDWQVGFGMWALIAVAALVPWVLIARHRGGTLRTSRAAYRVKEVARSGRAWVLAIFFGLQALQAYVIFSYYPTMLYDAGVPLHLGSAYVALVSLFSMAGAVVLPGLLARLRHPVPLVVLVGCGFLGGYLGTIIAPAAAPWLWSSLIGLGVASFPMGLFIVTQRAESPSGVLALSGFMQGIGYLIAGIFLVVFGAFQGTSTNWTPALIALIIITIVQTAAALVSVGTWTIEETLGRIPPGDARIDPLG